jgi:hypothetical protein
VYVFCVLIISELPYCFGYMSVNNAVRDRILIEIWSCEP